MTNGHLKFKMSQTGYPFSFALEVYSNSVITGAQTSSYRIIFASLSPTSHHLPVSCLLYFRHISRVYVPFHSPLQAIIFPAQFFSVFSLDSWRVILLKQKPSPSVLCPEPSNVFSTQMGKIQVLSVACKAPYRCSDFLSYHSPPSSHIRLHGGILVVPSAANSLSSGR